MQLMNPFSIILVCIIGYIMYVSKDEKTCYINFLILTIVINALYMQGYFVYIGGNERSYDLVMNIFFTLISMQQRLIRISILMQALSVMPLKS